MDDGKLKQLNFADLIQLDIPNVATYSFHDYAKNNFCHPTIKGYCTRCEAIGAATYSSDPNFCLRNMSHGASTKDFLESLNTPINTTGWNDSGVMFVMESPSKDYGIYKQVDLTKGSNTYHKCPAKQWYWIHNYQNISGYPQHFKGMTYGELVASAIVTFKLKNAYMTNLMKCGMNGPGDTYKGIDAYDARCIQKCYEAFLKKEIEIVDPKVIFTFGTSVFNKVSELVGNKIRVVGLPHPAGRRRGFKDEYYNVLYFCMIAKWLYRTGVIDMAFYLDMMRLFVA